MRRTSVLRRSSLGHLPAGGPHRAPRSIRFPYATSHPVRRVRKMEQASTERATRRPAPRGPGATVPPNAPEAQEGSPTGADTSLVTGQRSPKTDANFASETQALPYVAGDMRQMTRVSYADAQDRGGDARGSGEPMFPVDPRWGGYPPVDLTAHPGPIDVRILHEFLRGLAPATRVARAETVQPLPGQQKTDRPTIRRITTAGSTTCRAGRGLPLPEPKPAARGNRTPTSHVTSSPAASLHIGEDEWQADPVLITRGYEPVGGRPLTPESTRSTGSFATAFARTPSAASGPDHEIAELDISRRERGRVPSCVPQLTNEEARHAATFASTDGGAYVCWLCRTYGHAMYACPFLSPEQRIFTAYRNYRYQMERRPGMRNLLRQSAGEAGPRVKDSRTVRVGGHASPHEEAGNVATSSILVNDVTSTKRMRGTRAKKEEETGTDPGFLRRYRRRSCSSKNGQGIRLPCPRKEAAENRFSPPLKYCNVRTLHLKDVKYPNTS